MPLFDSSESENHENVPKQKVHSRQRPMHALLGGRKVADVLLWRDKTTSAALLIGVTTIWFLFEVVEYNFVALVCHISITSMLILFIWSTAAEYFNLPRPQIPEILIQESAFRESVSTLYRRFNNFLSKTLDIAYGRDPVIFFFVIVTLYLLSVIGSYLSFVNLLFLGFLFLETVPFLYDRYEGEVDYLAGRLGRDMQRIYRRLDSRVLNRLPRRPVKEKKK